MVSLAFGTLALEVAHVHIHVCGLLEVVVHTIAEVVHKMTGEGVRRIVEVVHKRTEVVVVVVVHMMIEVVVHRMTEVVDHRIVVEGNRTAAVEDHIAVALLKLTPLRMLGPKEPS